MLINALLYVTFKYTRHNPKARKNMQQERHQALLEKIKTWGCELGFQQIAVSNVDLSQHEPHLIKWLEQKFHGDMEWMERNTEKRFHPELLVENTLRVITARMDYRPESIPLIAEGKSDAAAISCYASGRDYHKTIRARLNQLAKKINNETAHTHRAFVDSAPVLERALAEKSGLGWIGKNTMLINKDAGSWFFLGELYTNLPLPLTTKQNDKTDNGNNSDNNNDNKNHCGTCTACIDDCPTQAIVAPNQVDARRCISYLTIEHKGNIPTELRPLIGNRIFGCDDCQIVCPWNKFSTATTEKDFSPREFTKNKKLHQLFMWTEEEFLKRTEGSPLRRVGYECWLRNIAVGLGTATSSKENIAALQARKNDASELVREHVEWALERLSL